MVKEFEELPSEEDYIMEGLEDYAAVICMAQKDAWNAAIKWAAEHADTHLMNVDPFEVDKESILRGLIK
ncbi:MAG: hypothetical protein ACRCXT_02770 [Paraclostridium sp.]